MEVSGRIVAVQEQRFRLLTDSGQVYLLTLAANGQLDAPMLADFRKRQTHLVVHFTGEPNLTGAIVRDIRQDGR
jgi:hypothetical protein